ncbi:MAG: cobalamin-binding protein [Candidatus Rokuibacteriota bacterium]|nr:MAG: cobalamin-binding protein [Candidatus Rokubacteria bacterium]
MYGRSSAEFPERIVCLTSETTEVVYAVGAGGRVVGVPGTAHRPPEARDKPKVGGFTTFRLDKILAFEPDLVLGFSDLQADVARDLVAAGVAVLVTNQRSFDEVLRTILLIGGALGCSAEARNLVEDMRDEVKQLREYSSVWPDRPRVYFEEWFDPLIGGIRWVSDMIDIAGGRDVFPELRDRRAARERVVTPDDVVRRDPEIILASWCGKPVDIDAIASRPGWDTITAVKHGQIHELDGADVLSPGPSLMTGLRRMHEIVQAYSSS